jgi:hypothetical protein
MPASATRNNPGGTMRIGPLGIDLSASAGLE